MNLEHRRIRDRDPLDQYVACAHWLDEARPEKAAFAKLAVLQRQVLLAHFVQHVARGFLARLAFAPSAIGAPFPRPPVFTITIAVERAFSGDRQVVLPV